MQHVVGCKHLGCLHHTPRLTNGRAEDWHTRLVRYYQYFGFNPVRVVEGGSLTGLADMLVWGGVGTRMDADIEAMLKRCAVW